MRSKATSRYRRRNGKQREPQRTSGSSPMINGSPNAAQISHAGAAGPNALIGGGQAQARVAQHHPVAGQA
jgi:hypothetical protein